MPIKRNEAGHPTVEMELLVPGTPEQVWHAMATGPGNTGWFVNAKIEPQAGGSVLLDFGQGMTTSGEVTTWDPPRRFAYVEREWSPGAPPCATEITITSHSGDRCVIRMSHSLFTSSDDWNDQLEGFESGWPGFFAVLRLYLEHFSGHDTASFFAMVPSPTDALSTWRRLCTLLDLTALDTGQRHTLTAPEPWSGLVERLHQDHRQRWYLLRLDAPTPGIVLVGTHTGGASSHTAAGPTSNVSLCRYYYGPAAARLATDGEASWRAWLSAAFSAPTEAQPHDRPA